MIITTDVVHSPIFYRVFDTTPNIMFIKREEKEVGLPLKKRVSCPELKGPRVKCINLTKYCRTCKKLQRGREAGRRNVVFITRLTSFLHFQPSLPAFSPQYNFYCTSHTKKPFVLKKNLYIYRGCVF